MSLPISLTLKLYLLIPTEEHHRIDIYYSIHFSSIHFLYFLFTEEDYDQFCLAYMFTYRDFEMGTLGLAWTGDLKNAGGVCEKNGVSSTKQFRLDIFILFFFLM